MSKPPIAGPSTEGRTLGTDWSVAHVAKLLRSNAERGAWDSSCASSGSGAEVNQYYFRKVSAKHVPTSVSLIFMRLAKEGCWYASLCFTASGNYLPWNDHTAEQWLQALFGDERSRVCMENTGHPSIRNFTLAAHHLPVIG